MASLVQSGAGTFINLNLNCKYDGTRFIPLFRLSRFRLRSRMEEVRPYSAAVTAILDMHQDISEDSIDSC